MSNTDSLSPRVLFCKRGMWSSMIGVIDGVCLVEAFFTAVLRKHFTGLEDAVLKGCWFSSDEMELWSWVMLSILT